MDWYSGEYYKMQSNPPDSCKLDKKNEKNDKFNYMSVEACRETLAKKTNAQQLNAYVKLSSGDIPGEYFGFWCTRALIELYKIFF